MSQVDLVERRRVSSYLRRALNLPYTLCEISEDILTYWGGNHYHACVLGLALIGKYGDANIAIRKLAESDHNQMCTFLSNELQISTELVLMIHLMGEEGMSAYEIARRLSTTPS